MARVVSIANRKGGCGKTTTTMSLAAGLAGEGHQVTVVDVDPQCNSTQSFGLNADDLKDGFTVADAYLSKVPASDIELDFGERFEGRLRPPSRPEASPISMPTTYATSTECDSARRSSQ